MEGQLWDKHNESSSHGGQYCYDDAGPICPKPLSGLGSWLSWSLAADINTKTGAKSSQKLSPPLK
jgi:hypothetical protein